MNQFLMATTTMGSDGILFHVPDLYSTTSPRKNIISLQTKFQHFNQVDLQPIHDQFLDHLSNPKSMSNPVLSFKCFEVMFKCNPV